MLAADAFMVFFRVVHIVTGVIWVGSLFVVVVFLQPIAAAIGRRVHRSCRNSAGAGSWT